MIYWAEGGRGLLSFLHSVQAGPVAPSSLLLTDFESSFPRDKGVGLEATTHLHLAQNLGMSGDKSPFHHLL